MLIQRRLPTDPLASEITPEPLYRARREFIRGTASFTALALAGCSPDSEGETPAATASAATAPTGDALDYKAGVITLDEPSTSYADVTSYNNFYEFGTDKADPARNAGALKTRPWEISVGGACDKPGRIGIDELLSAFPLEERIYRMRCVEAWSMVIPWVGIPLAAFLKRFAPNSKAKYVSFETKFDPPNIPSKHAPRMQWPYREGLRIDEAMHPLTILAVGLYGKVLPNQNGAPVRLVVPWKYGFKNIKSIERIDFTSNEPRTSWNIAAPDEYGFYANVNPTVDHPRWSQARERRIGDFLKRDTLMFNGYAEQVASLYDGMDLRRQF